MNTPFLFPHRFKKIGWILLLPGLLMGILLLGMNPEPEFLDFRVFSLFGDEIFGEGGVFYLTKNNLYDELAALLLISGALLVAFSQERKEDEFIMRTRLESLVWATYVNYAILLLAVVFVYDSGFFWILVFNMFTLLFFFIIRFNWALQRAKKQFGDEE